MKKQIPISQLVSHSRDAGYGGFPASAVTRDTFEWWKQQVLENQDKLIVTMHHYVLRDTTTASGFGEGNPRYHGASGGPEGSSYLYYPIEKDDPDDFKFTKDAHVFKDFLDDFHKKNGRGGIDFWIGGYTHAKGPDDKFGGETISESRWGVAFLQALLFRSGMLSKHHPPSLKCRPFRNLLKIIERNFRMKKNTIKQPFIKPLLVVSALLLIANPVFSADPPPLQIGTASKVITHEIGNWVQGAGMPLRAKKIRDDLEANALYLSNGETQLLLISCDLVGLEFPFAIRVREAMGKAAGIPARNILISCTHAHSRRAIAGEI